MLKTSAYILVFLSLTILFYCGSNTTDSVPGQETPKALQDDVLSYKRSGKSLMEDLYDELVTKSPELKTLEDNLDILRKKETDLKEAFDKYDSKSHHYYNSTARANSISDSLLRKKIEALLTSSQKKYSAKKSEIGSLLAAAASNNASLQDHHLVLKIVLTLPLMEEYQNDNLPDGKNYSEFTADQKKVIKEIGKLTPEF